MATVLLARVQRGIPGLFVNTLSISVSPVLAMRIASVFATSFPPQTKDGYAQYCGVVFGSTFSRGFVGHAPFALCRLETPTVVWNSECRHMLGVVLRELEGATPGLQDVPAIEVHEVQHTLTLFPQLGRLL